ncbi:hypothetical protein IV203_018390 [Nitzschia inconspicua]|uniref:Uncharacterized protein n=1 Tax=Nitzschia inconspicua TaxID=303405 RepID=A0A9K3M1S4_9STRA|nr:hypothetical protein IV203_018390 [Nitzschia inconspicua]
MNREALVQVSNVHDHGVNQRMSRDERRPSFTLSSASTCGSYKSNGKLSSYRSPSNESFHSFRDSNGSLGSICSSSMIRRIRQRNATMRVIMTGSNTSLTSLHSNGSLCSIDSNGPTNGRGSLRRKKSQSFGNLRDANNGPSSVRTATGTTELRKYFSFESIASVHRESSSGYFSTGFSSHESSHTSSGANFSWSSKGVVQMAQRSNGAVVKGVIDDLQRIVDNSNILPVKDSSFETDVEGNFSGSSASKGKLEEDLDVASVCEMAPLQQFMETERNERQEQCFTVPHLQCFMLAQWSRVDSYYKVVITKYHGIQVLIRAMNTFARSEDVQASCCVALANLNNKLQIFHEGGAQAILNAMKEHPNSISVQSAGLDALSGLIQLILNRGKDGAETLQEMIFLVQRTEHMYLTADGKKAWIAIAEITETCAGKLH